MTHKSSQASSAIAVGAAQAGRVSSATRLCVAFLFALGACPSLLAQDARATVSATAEPAQPTEEVPYVQTPTHVVHRMLQLADLKAGEKLWDLGSGDGRIVIAAAKRGARASGFEIDPRLVTESVESAKRAGVTSRAKFFERDIFTLYFSGVDVVSMYLLPEYNLKLRGQLLAQLSPGARIVSHEWDMGDWLPDEILNYWSPAKPHGTKKDHRVYLWVVPARVSGRWELMFDGRANVPAQTIELNVSQQFQRISARSNVGDVPWSELRGNQFKFAWRNGANARILSGTLINPTTLRGPGWRAIRRGD